eukprot:TRINITY_DN16919_c0_g2_i4.p1 TRINITY_DN16919_c0_g2~~TRINITY_DN16919_c0_g2_i4.p1  ORF type:complete len:422 (+),score=49.27 TRINITY_DN16919_c0_g2_i4:102-1367(+)
MLPLPPFWIGASVVAVLIFLQCGVVWLIGPYACSHSAQFVCRGLQGLWAFDCLVAISGLWICLHAWRQQPEVLSDQKQKPLLEDCTAELPTHQTSDPQKQQALALSPTDEIVRTFRVEWRFASGSLRLEQERRALDHWKLCALATVPLTGLYTLCQEGSKQYTTLQQEDAGRLLPVLASVVFSVARVLCKTAVTEICGPFRRTTASVQRLHFEFIAVWYCDLIYFMFYRFVMSQLTTFGEFALVACWSLGTGVVLDGLRFLPWFFPFEFRLRQLSQRCVGLGIPSGCNAQHPEDTRLKLLQRGTVFTGMRLGADILASTQVLLMVLLIHSVSLLDNSFVFPQQHSSHTSVILLGCTIGFDIAVTGVTSLYTAYVHDIRLFEVWSEVLLGNRAHYFAFLAICCHVATDVLVLFYVANYASVT